MRDEVEKLIVDWLKSDNENATYLAHQICVLLGVSVRYFKCSKCGSLAYQKAIEYAKFIHGEEYDDPIFAPDVEQTIRDFQSGFATAMRIANDR